MAKPSYADQLRDPRWQRRRLEKLEAAGWKCSRCEDTGTTLHVHHKHYIKGRLAWEYEDEYLAVLCEPCHAREHNVEEVFKAMLAYSNVKMSANEIAIGLLGGFLSGQDKLHPDWVDDLEQIAPGLFHTGALASLLLSDIEQMQPLMAQAKGGNDIQRRALERFARKPDGTNQNDQA